MTRSADVRSIEALNELRVGLASFGSRANSALLATDLEIQRTTDWLGQRKTHWQTEEKTRRGELDKAQAQLDRCRASGRTDRDGQYHRPDCSRYERSLERAENRLTEAKTNLRLVMSWIQMIQQAVGRYRRQARRFKSLLANDVAKAGALLDDKIADLESYVALKARTGGALQATTSKTHAVESSEKLAQYGDDADDLTSRYGQEMREFLARTPDEAGDLTLRTREAIEAAERLNEIGLNSEEASKLIEKIARSMTHGSGDRVVLGRWKGAEAGYVREAIDQGGTYYEIPRAVDDAMGRDPVMRWRVNEQYLRNQLESGVSTIDFVSGDVMHWPYTDSSSGKEIRFLLDNAKKYGYKRVGNKWIRNG